jgi:hypothetical protein
MLAFPIALEVCFIFAHLTCIEMKTQSLWWLLRRGVSWAYYVAIMSDEWRTARGRKLKTLHKVLRGHSLEAQPTETSLSMVTLNPRSAVPLFRYRQNLNYSITTGTNALCLYILIFNELRPEGVIGC